jgi:hypothetical protein
LLHLAPSIRHSETLLSCVLIPRRLRRLGVESSLLDATLWDFCWGWVFFFFQNGCDE